MLAGEGSVQRGCRVRCVGKKEEEVRSRDCRGKDGGGVGPMGRTGKTCTEASALWERNECGRPGHVYTTYPGGGSWKDRVPMREAGCGLRAVRVETSLAEGRCAWHLHAATSVQRKRGPCFWVTTGTLFSASPRHARGIAISRWFCILLLVPRPRVTRGGHGWGSGTWWDGEWYGDRGGLGIRRGARSSCSV